MSVESLRAAIDAALFVQPNELCPIVTPEEGDQITAATGKKLGHGENEKLGLLLKSFEEDQIYMANSVLKNLSQIHTSAFENDLLFLLIGPPIALLSAVPPLAGLMFCGVPGLVGGVLIDFAGLGLAYYLWDRADKAADAE